MYATIREKLSLWWDKAWVDLSPAGKTMLLIGLFGQSLFVFRWFIQLMASERAKRSVVPELFWYLSFGGALLVLIYAVYDANLVLMLGQFGIIIYARNLYFLWRNKTEQTAPESRPGE